VSRSRTMAVGRIAFFGFCAIMLVTPQSALAQNDAETHYQPDKVGKWRPGAIDMNDEAASGLTEQERSIFIQKLQKLVAIFREAKTLNPPVGVEASHGGDVDWGFPWGWEEMNPRPFWPVHGNVCIKLAPYIINTAGQPDVDEPDELWIFINELNPIFTGIRETGKEVYEDGGAETNTRHMEDELGTFFYTPKAVGVLQGRPLYECDAVVFTKIQKPSWIPVTRERFLRHAMDWAQKAAKAEQESLNESQQNLARLDKADREEAEKNAQGVGLQIKKDAAEHPGWLRFIPGEYLKALQAELASLTPQERASQAYFGDWKTSLRASGLVEPNEAGARPLVSPNPEFFNKSLPRTALQSIVIIGLRSAEEARRHPENPDPAQLRILELRDTLDWNKVMALFD